MGQSWRLWVWIVTWVSCSSSKKCLKMSIQSDWFSLFTHLLLFAQQLQQRVQGSPPTLIWRWCCWWWWCWWSQCWWLMMMMLIIMFHVCLIACWPHSRGECRAQRIAQVSENEAWIMWIKNRGWIKRCLFCRRVHGVNHHLRVSWSPLLLLPVSHESYRSKWSQIFYKINSFRCIRLSNTGKFE